MAVLKTYDSWLSANQGFGNSTNNFSSSNICGLQASEVHHPQLNPTSNRGPSGWTFLFLDSAK